MKVVSLFAGIGGFDEAFRREGHEIVWANEWDKYAAIIYEKNFLSVEKGFEECKSKRRDSPDCKGWRREWKSVDNFGRRTALDTRDIRKVPSSEIPEHDIICGGFPCQTFSIAGKRLGFSDTRGTLFREIMRIARDCRTKYLLLENVKGLLSHDGGRTLAVILSTMDELGYDAEWQVLNSKNFGVPQNRERIFIVGHLRGEPWKEVFPIAEGNRVHIWQDGEKQLRGVEISEALDSSYWKGADGKRTMILCHSPRNGNPKKGGTGPLMSNEHCFTLDSTPHMIMKEMEITKNVSDAQRIYDSCGISRTLKGESGGQGGKTGLYAINASVRRLTPLECERLQGFPDFWTEGISDSQRYKCLGNAVTVNVVQEIVRRLG